MKAVIQRVTKASVSINNIEYSAINNGLLVFVGFNNMDNLIDIKKITKKIKPNLVVVHGDRIESLSVTICSFLNNILTAHIEGGEISGTKDNIIRHTIWDYSSIYIP